MIEYTTFDDLETFGRQNLSEASVLTKSAQDRSPTSATFLSHSSKDEDLLPGLILILERHGADVYVDKKDEKLPPYTNRETAALLRERIKASRKFILFATPNSKNSRWVPWELGLADGYKNARNTAIFPASEERTNTEWTKQEYLGVYDRIVWGDLEGYEKPLWIVWNQEKNTASPLRRWLQS